MEGPSPVALSSRTWFDRDKRNVAVLVACQALVMTGTTLMITLSALVGDSLLSVDKGLATLPVTAMVTGTMLATVPASLWMGRVGRRRGFMTGTAFGVVGGLICSWAVYTVDFPLFCVGTLVMGLYNGFGQYYRFAAADVASEEFKSRSISLVLTGGVIAAVFGPELAKLTRELIPSVTYLASYLSLAGLSLVATLMLTLVDIPNLSKEQRRSSGRPLHLIMRQPGFIVAALSGMVGFASMSLIMTATPLAMMTCSYQHPFEDAAFVIQWHALGMFVPAFFTGTLIRRFGVLNIILAGAAMLIATVFVNLLGLALINFWFALVLLGVGWNFMFIGGTTLLTECYAPEERSKTQAANDLLVFGSVATASLASGSLLHLIGWEAVNYAALPFVLVTTTAVLWLVMRRHAAAGAA